MSQGISALGPDVNPAGNQGSDYVEGVGPTFDSLTSAVLEINPAFIETIEHPHPGHRVLHSLRGEQLMPRLAGYRHRTHRLSKHGRKGIGEIVRFYVSAVVLCFTFLQPDRRCGLDYGLDIRRELKIAIEKTNTFVEQHRRSFRWHKSTVLKGEQQSAAILRQLVQDLEALKMKELMPSRRGSTLPEPATRGVKVGSHSNERRQK